MVQPEVTLAMDGMLTASEGRLPADWFYHNGFETLSLLPELIESGNYPLVGKVGTLFWLSSDVNMYKHDIIVSVRKLAMVMQRRAAGSVAFLVMHPPVEGSWKMVVIQFNNNLMFAA